ncbi:MAG: metallophosphoesterase family protein, partial [Aeromicrobium sp.]
VIAAAVAVSPFGTSAAFAADEAPLTGAPERVILNPTTDPSTSQLVTWRSVDVAADTASKVEVRDTAGNVTTVAGTTKKVLYIGADNQVKATAAEAAKTAVTFTAELTNLEPDTSYAYRPITGDEAGEWNTFTTASAAADPYTFTWYADGQNYLTQYWTPIVDFTSKAFPNSELTLQSGDLIDLSVENEWQEWFDITDGERQTENWLVAPGNHEYSRDAAASFWDANFTPAHNGPTVDPTADASTQAYEQLVVDHLKNKAYYTDYQGVRFIQLNSQLVGQSAVEASLGVDLPNLESAAWQQLYLNVQSKWLDRVLEESTANWDIVSFHHPTFSVSQGRNQPLQRAAWLPIFQKHNVDLVLSGHDHTYGRGYLNADAVDGATNGPVFAVSNSGPKHYNLATDETNVWLNNGATQVTKYQHISLTQGIRVTPTTLEYEAVVAQTGVGANPNTDLQVGDTGDAFTIVRHADGSKSVTEGIQRRVATGLGGTTDPVEGDLVVEAEIPELGAGALSLNIDAADQKVALGEAVNDGDRWSFEAQLPVVSVTDTRTDAAGWSVTVDFDDLVGTRGTIESSHLGWFPRVLDAATARAGQPVSGALSGGEGLVGAQLLAGADDHSRWGTTRVGADVTLEAPIGAQAGTYEGAVRVSLFPVD